MPAPSNLSFETAGASPGLALGWTWTVLATAEAWTTFSPSGLPLENFGLGWSNDPFWFELEPGDLTPAQLATLSFNPKLAEDFEELWLINQTFPVDLAANLAAAGFGVDTFETWPTGYLTTLAPGDLTAAAFGVDEFEDWAVGYLTTLAPGDFTAPVLLTFTALVSVEAFVDVDEPRLCIVNPTTERVELTAHGFLNTTPIKFRVENNGTLPVGLNTLDLFHAFNVTANDFQVYENDFGVILTFSDNGTGKMYVVRNSDLYWTDDLGF